MEQIQKIDLSVIPSVFYNAVINRNRQGIINIAKYYPNLSLNVIKFYNTVLKLAYAYKNNNKSNTCYKVIWQNINKDNVILTVPQQYFLYMYCVSSTASNFGFLVNTINNYLVELRAAMKMINNKEYAGFYFPLSINAKNNIEMKIFISKFITQNNII